MADATLTAEDLKLILLWGRNFKASLAMAQANWESLGGIIPPEEKQRLTQTQELIHKISFEKANIK